MTTNSDRLWFRCVRTYADGRIEYLFPTDEKTARTECIASPETAVKIELQQIEGSDWITIATMTL